ncbi:MAG: AAA family ATPase [Bacilli bacterium]
MQKTDPIIDQLARGQLSVQSSLEQLRQIYRRDAPRSRSGLMRFGAPQQDEDALPANPLDAGVDPVAAKETLLRPLRSLIGLGEVKKTIDELYAHLAVQTLRRHMGLKADGTVLHMIFAGRPGTGKTTVARMLGPVFAALGVLTQGHVVEVERADLVGEYVGHTAQRTRTLLDRAMGGVLFVDEAYALARGGDKDFGREAIDTLVKGMEDRNGGLIVILAGYKEEMSYFMSVNPGLSSRFPVHISFPDFTEGELLLIAARFLEERQYRLSSDALSALRQRLRRERAGPDFGNGRTVRNVIERAMRRQALRVIRCAQPTRQDVMTLFGADFWEGDDHASMSRDWQSQRW